MRNDYFYGLILGAVLTLSLSGCGMKADAAISVPETQEQTEPETVSESTVVEKITGEIESMEESEPEPAPLVRMFGTAVRTEGHELVIDNHSGFGMEGEIGLTIDPDTTYILDSMTGFPVEEEDIQEGELIYVYAGDTMTLSSPPKAEAQVIFTGIATDAKVPDYAEIHSAVTDAASARSVLTTSEGVIYTLSEDCMIVPYHTRNRLTMDDLSEGKKCAVWSDDAQIAFKIMVLE